VSPTRQRALLAGILVLAAALRFTGLGWGLRHTPHWDERVFVENARAMVEEKSLDHRYYEYPALFFDMLVPILALLPRETLAGPAAFLVTRSVVAAFGVLSVLLVCLLGTRLAGPAAGLSAALLLAASPVDVVTAHMVRPDVVLGSFALLAMLAFRRLGPDAKGDVVAGAAIGAATAVKFTGALLAPSYLLARLLAPGPRLSRIVLAGFVAVGLAVLVTPYAIIHYDAYLDGVRIQMGAHYKGRDVAPSYLKQVGFYLGVIPVAFGPLGALLLAAGLVLALREWRTWAPLVAHPLTTLMVLATAELRYERHLVPTTGILALLAGRAVAAVAERRPKAAAALTALAAALPLVASANYARQIARPNTKDRALDAVAASVPAGARIVTGVPDLGLDRGRYEVMTETRWEPDARILARDVDLVIWPALDEPPRELAPIAVFRSPEHYGGLPVLLARTAAPPAYEAVRIEAASVSASENTGVLSALVDGRLETSWQTEGPQQPEQWIAVSLAQSIALARVTLSLGAQANLYGQNLHLSVTENGKEWRRVPTVAGRPPVDEQLGTERSQVLLLDPMPARGFRIVQVGRRRKPWSIAELRVDALR
jgi:hypothetical protein